MLYLLAESYLWSRQYEKVVPLFEQLQREAPDSAPAHMLMGEALDGLKRTDQAIAEFKAAASLSPAEPNVQFGLGYLYWKKRNYDEAATRFEQELRNDPLHANAKAYLGDIYYRRHQFAYAQKLLQEAGRLSSKVRIAYVDLGAIARERKQYELAIASLKRAIVLDPDQTDAHYQLALTAQAMGRREQAEDERRKMQRLEKNVEEELLHRISGAPSLSQMSR
jgi:tetratricopeptide (TPR) repeat protein